MGRGHLGVVVQVSAERVVTASSTDADVYSVIAFNNSRGQLADNAQAVPRTESYGAGCLYRLSIIGPPLITHSSTVAASTTPFYIRPILRGCPNQLCTTVSQIPSRTM